MIKVYFIINKNLNVITGVVRYPTDNTADYKNIEYMMTEDDFQKWEERYYYQGGVIKKL